MKYIKQYEKIIAAKSEKAKRNPLYDFSGKISQILRNFKDVDSIFSTTKRYIEDDGYITIKINYTSNGSNLLSKITLDYDERLDKGTMVIRAHSEVPYNITWALKEDGNSNVWVKEKEIERLLTPEEIEIYKELKTTYKFNI